MMLQMKFLKGLVLKNPPIEVLQHKNKRNEDV